MVKILLEPDKKARELLERTLKELESSPSSMATFSAEELASIVGGAYMKALRAIKSMPKPSDPTGEDKNCGPGSCHPACNSWCHDFTV